MINFVDKNTDTTNETDIPQETTDLTFLEATDQVEDFFTFENSHFSALSKLSPKPVFVPSLKTSVFEEPMLHAVWSSNVWPSPTRHFPN